MKYETSPRFSLQAREEGREVLDAQQLLAAIARANGLASRGMYVGPHPTAAGGATSLHEGFRGWRAEGN